MGGIRPETRAMKRHKIAKKNNRRLKKITPNNLGIPPKANQLRVEVRRALAQAAKE